MRKKAGFSILIVLYAIALVAPSLVFAQSTSANLEGLLSKGAELAKSKDYSGAEKMYRQALAIAPENPDILKALGDVCQKQFKYKESIAVFDAILKRAPLYPGVNHLLGVSYYALNEFDKAVDAEKKELVGDPTNQQARYYLALALDAVDRKAEAIEQLEQLRAINPKDQSLLYQLAQYYKQGAEQMTQRLAALNPDSEWIHALNGEAFTDAQRYQEALLEFKEALRLDPDLPGMHFALGQVYWLQRDYVNAQPQLQLALGEDPQQPLANFYEADILSSQRQFDAAIPHVQIAISTYPRLTQAYFILGKCYVGTGNLQRALEVYKKAIDLDPGYKEVHYQLSELYKRLGDKDKSEAELQVFQKLVRQGQEKSKTHLQQGMQRQAAASDN
jgi:tetratricopeptide (TPR) repeat protein